MTAAQHRRATGSPRRRGTVGLALAGGGPLGGIYEVGALLALTDSIENLDCNALDIYVGVSSGSFVAAALANGISPAQMYRLFIDDGRDAVLRPEIFLRPAFAEFARRAGAAPALALRATLQYLRDPLHRGVMESIATLARAIPTGLFDNRAIDAFLTRLFAAPSRTNDFRRLRAQLYLVATNLDTGKPIAFGVPGTDHVPISRAIEASSALPGLFPPVAIDGEHYVDGALNKTLHASLALDAGADLLLCVNPLVPFDAPSAHRRGRLTHRKLDRGGSDASELIREHIARVKEIAVQFPRLRTRVVTGAADYGATPENSFETGLQAIFDGLEAKLARAPFQDDKSRGTDAHAAASVLPRGSS